MKKSGIISCLEVACDTSCDTSGKQNSDSGKPKTPLQGVFGFPPVGGLIFQSQAGKSYFRD